jgi:Rrf2 family nitric oxide-sensitive transcriptional repressor
MLSHTAEYALRAIVALAQDAAAVQKAHDIARESQVPPEYLSKILNSLVRAGILNAQRGRGGGFSLALPARELSVLDVVNAVDPLQRIRSCPLKLKAHAFRLCALHRKLDEALALVENAFASSTIAELCGTPALCNDEDTTERTYAPLISL